MKERLIITLTYLVSAALSYSFMLIIMTYNAGIFIAAILGLTTGHFIFGYLKKVNFPQKPEEGKCCH